MTELHSHPQHRILMVDDDKELRTMMGLLLAGEGYSVSHADNGTDAVLLHEQNPFDLIIMELFMDGKDGFQTLMALRRHPAPVKLIAVAKEGWMSSTLCLRIAGNLGAHSVLAKPFGPEQMLSAVRNVLNAPR